MNPSLRPEGSRHVLRFERVLRHPPAKVWRALTDPAHLTHWFPADVELTLEVGTPIRFVFRGDQAPTDAWEGEVLELDEPRLFVFSWSNEILRWELSEHAEGQTLLRFEHTFDDRPGAASFAAGWTLCIDSLEVVCDGDVPDDPAGVAAPVLHERFVAEFGLDEGAVLRHGGGWLIRFDRQFTRPTGDVWSALATFDPVLGEPPPVGFIVEAVEPTGPVVDLEPPTGVEYEVPGGRVRFQLTDGPGGARLVLLHTVAGDVAADLDALRIAWREHLRRIASELAPAA